MKGPNRHLVAPKGGAMALALDCPICHGPVRRSDDGRGYVTVGRYGGDNGGVPELLSSLIQEEREQFFKEVSKGEVDVLEAYVALFNEDIFPLLLKWAVRLDNKGGAFARGASHSLTALSHFLQELSDAVDDEANGGSAS